MKIVILSRAPLAYYAGIPRFCKALADSLKLNHTVLNYSLTNASKSSFTTSIHVSKSIPRLTYTELTYKSEFIYKTLAFSFGYLKALLVLPLKEKILFHYQHPDPFSAFSILLSKLISFRNVKIVCTWHANIYKSYLLFSPILFFLDLLLFFLCDEIVFPTKSHYSSSLFCLIPLVSRKVSFIPFGLYSKNFLSVLSFPSGVASTSAPRLNFLSIGRLVPYKGYKSAIKAFYWLKQNHNDFCYNIIGSGPLFDSLKNLITHYRLDDHIFIHSDVDDNRKKFFLSNASCFILPSISQAEAFGLVQLEAFAYQLPIVNTFLRNGVNEVAPPSVALTIPSNSPILLSSVLYDFCINPNLLSELSSLSKKRAHQFSLEYMSDSYLNLFQSIFL